MCPPLRGRWRYFGQRHGRYRGELSKRFFLSQRAKYCGSIHCLHFGGRETTWCRLHCVRCRCGPAYDHILFCVLCRWTGIWSSYERWNRVSVSGSSGNSGLPDYAANSYNIRIKSWKSTRGYAVGRSICVVCFDDVLAVVLADVLVLANVVLAVELSWASKYLHFYSSIYTLAKLSS